MEMLMEMQEVHLHLWKYWHNDFLRYKSGDG